MAFDGNAHELDDKLMDSKVERILWSIAIPGFGQLLNGRILKGLLFITLELVVNSNAHLNLAIMMSFQGKFEDAIQATNFQWLMFYPCVYMFAIWDAFRDAGGGQIPFSYLPFIFPAFLGTVGVIYSPQFRIMGYLLGNVWLPMVFAVIGTALGYALQKILLRFQ